MSSKILFETDHITLKENDSGWQFVERVGKDSVALFLVRCLNENDWEILVRYQPSSLFESDLSLVPSPVTGSMDEDETPSETAIRETFEETGYIIEDIDLKFLGSFCRGYNTNELIYLYLIDVTDIKEPLIDGGQDGSYMEEISENIWELFDRSRDFEDATGVLGYYIARDLLY